MEIGFIAIKVCFANLEPRKIEWYQGHKSVP